MKFSSFLIQLTGRNPLNLLNKTIKIQHKIIKTIIKQKPIIIFFNPFVSSHSHAASPSKLKKDIKLCLCVFWLFTWFCLLKHVLIWLLFYKAKKVETTLFACYLFIWSFVDEIVNNFVVASVAHVKRYIFLFFFFVTQNDF